MEKCKWRIMNTSYCLRYVIFYLILVFFFFSNSITKQGWPKCWLALQQWPKLLLFSLCKLFSNGFLYVYAKNKQIF